MNYRTLNEYESLVLERLLSLSQQIIHSGFDNPTELYNELTDILNELDNSCERYYYYQVPRCGISLNSELWPEL